MRRGSFLGPRPLTPAGRRLGRAAAGLAVFNWAVFAVGLMVPAVPALHHWLLGAGTAGWVFMALLVASGFFVGGVAWYLVERVRTSRHPLGAAGPSPSCS